MHLIQDKHVPCISCGYDLHGSSVNRCPECGYPFDPDAIVVASDRKRRIWRAVVDLIKVIAGIVTIVVSFFLGGFLGAGQDYAPVISVLAGLSGFLIGFSRFLSPTQQIAAVIIIEALLLSILRKYETVDGTIGYTVGINVRVILPWLGSALVAYCLRRLIAN